MEPGILEVLRRYLELGGSAQNGVDFLIDKYVGKSPAMFMCILQQLNWSCAMLTLTTVLHCIGDQLASAGPNFTYQVTFHAVGYAQMASLVCSWMAKTESHVQQTNERQVADEVSHMQV